MLSRILYSQTTRLTWAACLVALSASAFCADDNAKIREFGTLGYKVDPALIPSIKAVRDGLATNAAATHGVKSALGRSLISSSANRLPLTLDVPAVNDAVLKEIEATGALVFHSSARWNSVSLYASVEEIDALANLQGVRLIHLARRPHTRQAGVCGNQADADQNAGQARIATGVTGAGQKIGVMSNSCNQTTIGPGTITGTPPNAMILTGLTNQLSGDLPAQIQVIDFGPNDVVANDGSFADEGSAMMELIHDIAPNASLVFASAYSTQTAFATNLLALGQAGCTVTCDDVGYFEEPYFQDGPISQAIATNYAKGIPHFTAAGNDYDNGIMGVYTPVNAANTVDSGLRPPNGGDFHDWKLGAGTTPGFLPIDIQPGSSITPILQWNQPFQSYGLGAGSSVDLDMYLFDAPSATANVLAKSERVQCAGGKPGGDPLEDFTTNATYQDQDNNAGYVNTSNSVQRVYLAINHFAGSRVNTFFRIVIVDRTGFSFPFGGGGAISIYGHSACDQAIACAAIFSAEVESGMGYGTGYPIDTPDVHVEKFSSKGGSGVNGIPFFFDTLGNPFSAAPQRRNKPDISSVDGSTTTFFGSEFHALLGGIYYPAQSNHYPSFFGTSAAAPNAAAVAALLKERAPLSTPAQIKNALQSTARLSVLGVAVTPPERIGAGLLDAYAAIQAMPAIVTNPNDLSVGASQAATFSVTASGAAVLTYQWQKGGVNISGATTATLTLNAVQLGDDGSTYQCIVSNASGTVVSGTAVLHIVPAPMIVTNPSDQTVNALKSATFSLSATGAAPLVYQWQKGGVNISGATSAMLAFTNVQNADDGTTYRCGVSNAGGTTYSSAAVLHVIQAPTIVTNPSDQTVNAFKSATFSVSATGAAPLAYQWQKGGTIISGATSATLTLNSVQNADDGSKYQCIVSNSVSTVTSTAAVLHVNLAPVIITQPANQFIAPGFAATFSVVAASGNPAYQWQRAGVNISGATSASYTTGLAVASDSGAKFSCVVSNAAASISSSSATLNVDSEPWIMSGPFASATVVKTGVPVTFSVAAVGAFGQSLTYVWGFGDGSFDSSGPTVTHTFAAQGMYGVTVFAMDPLNLASSGTVNVNVFNDDYGDGLPYLDPAVDNSGYPDFAQHVANLTPVALKVDTLAIMLNFKTGSRADSLVLGGTLPIPPAFTVLGQHVVIVVGGFGSNVVLDKKGSAVVGSLGTFQLKANTRSQTAQYSLKVSKAALSSFFAASGLTDKTAKNELDSVRVTIFFNGGMHDVRQPQTYTAVKGKSGKTK